MCLTPTDFLLGAQTCCTLEAPLMALWEADTLGVSSSAAEPGHLCNVPLPMTKNRGIVACPRNVLRVRSGPPGRCRRSRVEGYRARGGRGGRGRLSATTARSAAGATGKGRGLRMPGTSGGAGPDGRRPGLGTLAMGRCARPPPDLIGMGSTPDRTSMAAPGAHAGPPPPAACRTNRSVHNFGPLLPVVDRGFVVRGPWDSGGAVGMRPPGRGGDSAAA